jgi:excisionase family DNA binding protein
MILLTADELRQVVRDAVRAELAELRRDRDPARPLTFAEAARRLECSARTVSRRVKDGTYQSVQVGRMTRVVLPESTDGQGVA